MMAVEKAPAAAAVVADAKAAEKQRNKVTVDDDYGLCGERRAQLAVHAPRVPGCPFKVFAVNFVVS
jgi:hypothetical protein